MTNHPVCPYSTDAISSFAPSAIQERRKAADRATERLGSEANVRHGSHGQAMVSRLRGFPNAPTLCLAKFDELLAVGLDTFIKKYDPYWDIPTVEAIPPRVLEFADDQPSEIAEGFELTAPRGAKRRGARSRR